MKTLFKRWNHGRAKRAAGAADKGTQGPLFLQEYQHQGKRVVIGQRALKASSGIFPGWATVHGRPYYVRQMKNMKDGVPIEWQSGESFNFVAWACGSILARAYARTSEPAVLAGYRGNSKVLDEALAA